MKLSDADIESILNEVQDVLATVTKAEKTKAAKLAKSDEDSAGGDDDDAPGAADDAGAPPGADAGPPPGADAGPPPGADAGAPPGADPAGDPAAAGGPTDPAALQAEYAKLPIDELKMHAEAAMAALQAAMGGAGAGGPPGPDAGAPPPPDAGMAPAMKKEIKVDGNGGSVRKSEKDAEVEALKKSLSETQQIAERLTSAFHTFVTKPMRKAETGVPAPGAKPPEAPLSKSEAVAKLRGKIRDVSLSKKDREVMNAVFVGEKDPLSPDVAHLLK